MFYIYIQLHTYILNTHIYIYGCGMINNDILYHQAISYVQPINEYRVTRCIKKDGQLRLKQLQSRIYGFAERIICTIYGTLKLKHLKINNFIFIYLPNIWYIINNLKSIVGCIY